MSIQYFTTKVNLEKIEDLEKYLAEMNFISSDNPVPNSFTKSFQKSFWKNEFTKTEIRVYNPKNNLCIETCSMYEETNYNKNLILKILEIVKAERLINGAGEKIDLNLGN